MSSRLWVPQSFWSSVHFAGGGSSWPPAPGEADLFVRTLEQDRLLLVADPGSFDSSVAARLEARRLQLAPGIEARVEEQARTLERLTAVLTPGSWIGVKGVDLGRRLFGDMRLRPMEDLDLLVDPAAMRSQMEAIDRGGFADMHPHGPFGIRFTDPENGVPVDMYCRLTQPQRVAIDYASMWSEARPLAGSMLVLAPHHALAAQALTMISTELTSPIRRYLDFYLLTRGEETVRAAAEVAGEWRMRRALYASLAMLSKIVPEVRDEGWFPAVEGLLPGAQRRFLERRALPPKPTSVLPARPVSLWRKLWLMDEWSQRSSFLAAHLAQTIRRRSSRFASA